MLLLYLVLSAAPPQVLSEGGLRVTLLLDTSARMDERIRNVRAVETLHKLTSNRSDLSDAIGEIRKAGGASALRNGLFVAAKSGANDGQDKTRHAIVVISDGNDTSSRVTEEEVEEAVASAGSRVYAIVLPTERRRSSRGESRWLATLARATGAKIWEPSDVEELESAVEALSLELKELSSIE